MILTYKYRVKDRSARKALSLHAVAVNQVWNYCNAYQKDLERRYKAGSPKRSWPSSFDLHKLTAGTSKLLGLGAESINAVCSQFASARDKARGSLRFRSSFGSKRALGWVPFKTKTRQIDGNSVTYLGKRYRSFGTKRRPIPDTAKGGAFIEDARGRWWLTLHVEVEEVQGKGTGGVGIDLGLKTFATVSDGSKIENPRHLRQYAERLAVAQRSGNKKRARAIHTKIDNVRKDFLHKASASLVAENRLIVVGNVSSSKLAKTKMAKSVLDAGWSMFRNQLRYKASRHGVVYVEADERNTSQTCSSCGSLPPERPRGIAGLGIRRWECSDCRASHDRDVNAALNILRVGRSAAPPAEGSRA